MRLLSVGLWYMVAGAFAFSVMSALVKAGGATLPTMELVLGRSVGMLLLVWGTLRLRGIGLWGGERRLLVLRGVLGFIALSAFYYSVVHLPLADATVIQYTNPVWTALIAAVVLGEHLRPVEVVVSVASLLGVALVARPTFLFGGEGLGLDPLAVGVALAGAVFSAAAYVTVRRLRGEEAMVVVWYFALISSLAALPAVVPVWVTPTPGEWGLLAAIGISTYLGQIFMTWGLQRERAGKAMAVGYLQIVFAGLWGFLFFAEVPDAWGIAGAALVVASTLALGRRGGTDPAGEGEPAGAGGADAGRRAAD
ncbi:MAG: DMT family transporter [Gemmatimonadetes bacterium]|nr:DMT family transporter [Gemmatimonadota bacterium]